MDTALDVDNWLRERPVGETPRLKIFARFASLLTHLADGRYTGVVIVAHSQGTVIASEFFRYLHQQQNPLLSRLPPLRLLSMGSPLRQLYALRLPVLYRWVRKPEVPAAANDPMGPVPAECGFLSWVNAYGSGDYVGRYLWLRDDDPDRWQPGDWSPNQNNPFALDSDCDHFEFCVGAAAHTHYFDENNTEIGECVDALIAISSTMSV